MGHAEVVDDAATMVETDGPGLGDSAGAGRGEPGKLSTTYGSPAGG
ncbi:MAG: hypothetical protein HOV83_34410 [Catenulispora sp.]|nr:hypothetical protein [Catenulispora sp.]